ncbi:MAG: Dps family protein [Candidatus Promineifilaceae bacterium]|jgi:starvation-inducible DNA-binding protein
MATKSMEMEQVNIGLDEKDTKALNELLNVLLADEHVLYVKTRNFHWNMRGMDFMELHELLDAHYNSLQEISDQIAERSRMLGAHPLGSMGQFLEKTRLTEEGDPTLATETMLEKLVADHESIIRSLREDIAAAADEYGDEGTADLLIGTLREHEKMAWMLRSFLK